MGETYGVPVAEIVEGIQHGVRKINIDTDLRMVTTGALRQFLIEHPKEFDPRKYLRASTIAMSELCKQRFEAFGSAGQAATIKPIKCETMAEHYKSGQLQAVVK